MNNIDFIDDIAIQTVEQIYEKIKNSNFNNKNEIDIFISKLSQKFNAIFVLKLCEKQLDLMKSNNINNQKEKKL